MAEYIEREDLEIVMNNWRNFLMHAYGKDDHYTSGFDEAVKIVENFTSADVATVVHGRWIDAYPDIEPNPMFMYGICSECGFEQGISKYLKYCPNCGCRMDGGAD